VRVLIAGAEGQIGRAMGKASPPGAELRGLNRAELDLTCAVDVARVVSQYQPDLLVNAAGYTAVDRAETEPDAARAVNEEGARYLAEAAARIQARMLHFSTDYVFAGEQRRPYQPGDRPNPLNAYGASKLAGEQAVLGVLGDRVVVLRTAWVYAATGHNFLRTMLHLMDVREQVTVVSDQIGTPTSSASVARAAWAMAGRADLHGIAHWTDEGVASWYEFAVGIREEALDLGLLRRAATILPIGTEEYAAPARRPRYSVLDCSATRAALQRAPDHWRVALRRTLQELADA
jgi:dTDP-4-dehydrorhamnose reductase